MTNADKLNVLYGGTKVLQVSPPAKDAAPDGGCLCVVARTGFGTSQGGLVRTMIFSTERVSANNIEALFFILFLCLFAIAASAYVWKRGVENDRKRSKLLLDCILIITSVVPPELPMELSMAVNTSLVALSKFGKHQRIYAAHSPGHAPTKLTYDDASHLLYRAFPYSFCGQGRRVLL